MENEAMNKNQIFEISDVRCARPGKLSGYSFVLAAIELIATVPGSSPVDVE
jgi:hypothetical protein